MSNFLECAAGMAEEPDSPAGANKALDVLRRRRSMKRWLPDPVPGHLIETLLEAAVWAPNHHKTEPWRFVVITDDARRRLGEVMASSVRSRLEKRDDELVTSLEVKARNKPLQAPVVIAVAAIPGSGPKVREIEEIEATAASVENMLIAAEAVGLGAIWRTGDFAYDKEVKRFLGLPVDAHLVAFVYLGYPDMPELPERVRSARLYTTWLNSSNESGIRELKTD